MGLPVSIVSRPPDFPLFPPEEIAAPPSMEFRFAIFFLLFYYIRPQDWVPGLSGVELIKPIVGLWVMTLVSARSLPSPLPGWNRTPHDLAILAYLTYLVAFGGAAITAVLPMLAFYGLTVQSVNSWSRLLTYLKVWTIALVVLAALGVLSTIGIDLTGAQDNRFTQLGRLAIGTWLHGNPNALGHSIVTAIPAAFLLYFWKGTSTGRFVIFPLMAALTFYCAWLTQSKGSYLVGGALLVVAFIIGKPRWFQVTALAAAATVGISALSFLPRMGDMNNLRADEGVQGRLLSWEMARTEERNHPTGVGWNKHISLIPWREGERVIIVPIATHSSYVQIGADLGRYGLFLYLAGIWCALHTLLVFKTADTSQERCRRILLVFLIGNLISGWMINREYHTEYFLLIATTAALHRLRKAESLPSLDDSTSAEPIEMAVPPAARVREVLDRVNQAWRETERPAFRPDSANSHLLVKPFWSHFGILDLVASIGLTWFTFWMWDYILKNL